MKTRSDAGRAACALLLLGAGALRAAETTGAAAGAAENPDHFLVRDLGIEVVKPSSWSFVSIDESRVSRFDLVAKSAGIDAAKAVSIGSITICQMNKYPTDRPPEKPNPAVAISLQNMVDVPQVTDARELAKYAVTSLSLLYRDIEFLEFLEPVIVGGLPGFKNRFRAGIDPKIWDGKLIVEQHFVMQERIAVCVTYQDGEESWKSSQAEFAQIRDSLVIPAKPALTALP